MKRRGEEVTGEKRSSKKLVTVVTTAMIVMAAVITALFVASAAPGVDTFTIEPDKGITNAVSSYNATINTTGFTTLNITIPPGFKAVAPSGGDLIARADLWWASGYYGYVTFTANSSAPSTKMDVYANIGGGQASFTEDVNYTEGATTSIYSPFGTHPERATLKLPTATESGYLNITGLPETLTNATISIGQFVRNPATAANYEFEADGKTETVQIIAPTFDFEFKPPTPADGADVPVGEIINITVNVSVTADSLKDNLSALVLNWTDGTSINETKIVGTMVDNFTWSWNVTDIVGAENLTADIYTYTVYANDTWNNWGNSTPRTVNVMAGVCGDVNGDDYVTGYDVTVLELYVGEVPGWTITSEWAADVSGDGEVTGYDATVLALYVGEVPGWELNCQ